MESVLKHRCVFNIGGFNRFPIFFTHAERSVLIRSPLFFLSKVANIGATFGGTIVFTKLGKRLMGKPSTALFAADFAILFLPNHTAFETFSGGIF